MCVPQIRSLEKSFNRFRVARLQRPALLALNPSTMCQVAGDLSDNSAAIDNSSSANSHCSPLTGKDSEAPKHAHVQWSESFSATPTQRLRIVV